MKAVALNLMKFFEDESCGQCTPCRVGTEKAVKLMEQGPWDPALLTELSDADARRLDLRPRPGRAESAAVRAEIFPRRTDQAAGTLVIMANDEQPVGYGHDHKGAHRTTSATQARRAHVVTVECRAGQAQHLLHRRREVDIRAGETIFRAARRLDIKLPHLCYSPKPGYRPDGNCRVCMVEIEGERVLAASCIRTPTPGMKVKTQTDRAKTARRMVAELLMTDQPDQAHRARSGFRALEDRQAPEDRGRPLPQARADRGAARPTAATWRWRSISTPASSAISASAPAARCRSTTSSAWPAAAISKRSCSTSTIRWAPRPASPAANACRPARPAR